MTNRYQWPLPLTDAMIEDEMPYAPLPEPAEDIAQRLVMLAHLTFNQKIWGSSTGRIERYWPALGEHIETATNNPDLASWWQTLMGDIVGVPLVSMDLLHEKNLLLHPRALPGTQVEDEAVLQVLRDYTLDLRDRARVWARTRRAMRNAVAQTEPVDLEDL